MERYEIEDIAFQDQDGVVFRAVDRERDTIVSIRRFFPFGQHGEGLDEEERIAYEIAAKRLSTIRHPALRCVIEGSADPIDGIPYLVTEWIEGTPLSVFLDDAPLDPALAIDLLHQAIEVCVILSHVLGEEAVWIETSPESILVGSEESGRGFTFWISPLRWLGAQSGSRDLTSIGELAEKILGWSGKIVSDQAGFGLGGWIRWVKNHPDSSFSEALQNLAASTGNDPPPAEEVIVSMATKKAVVLKSASSKTPLLVTAAVALLTLGVTLVYLHKTAVVPEVVAALPGDDGSAPLRVPVPAAPVVPVPADPMQGNANGGIARNSATSARDRASELAAELSRQATARRDALAASGGVLSAGDTELFAGLAANSDISVKGTLVAVTQSSTGRTFYLHFSERDDTILGGIYTRNFTDGFEHVKLADLVGKSVIIKGRVHVEIGSGRRLVLAAKREQIQAATD